MAKSDILVTPARIWYAPVGEALPSETTVAYGATWGGNWKSLGETLEPVSANLSTSTFDLRTQQSIVPVRVVRTEIDATIETTLAEITGDNLALVMDATKTTTAAGAAQNGFDAVTVKGDKSDVSLYAFGIEGFRVHSTNVRLPVRIFVPQGSIVMTGAISFANNAGAGIPVQIKALADGSGNVLTIHNVTAPATA